MYLKTILAIATLSLTACNAVSEQTYGPDGSVAQASAEPQSMYDTGNDWLLQSQSDQFSRRIAASAHLFGMDRMHDVAGLAGECVPAPDGVIYGQIEALVIKWLEDNPDKRHQFLPLILHEAKKEAWGSFPLPADKPIC